jgi:DNA-binding ferritin-like protein
MKNQRINEVVRAIMDSQQYLDVAEMDEENVADNLRDALESEHDEKDAVTRVLGIIGDNYAERSRDQASLMLGRALAELFPPNA